MHSAHAILPDRHIYPSRSGRMRRCVLVVRAHMYEPVRPDRSCWTSVDCGTARKCRRAAPRSSRDCMRCRPAMPARMLLSYRAVSASPARGTGLRRPHAHSSASQPARCGTGGVQLRGAHCSGAHLGRVAASRMRSVRAMSPYCLMGDLETQKMPKHRERPAWHGSLLAQRHVCVWWCVWGGGAGGALLFFSDAVRAVLPTQVSTHPTPPVPAQRALPTLPRASWWVRGSACG